MVDESALEAFELAPLLYAEAELVLRPHSTATWIDRRRCLKQALALIVVRLEEELVAGVHESYVTAVSVSGSGHGLDPRRRHAHAMEMNA